MRIDFEAWVFMEVDRCDCQAVGGSGFLVAAAHEISPELAATAKSNTAQ
jgi:hypothetical protein